eukprot:5245985-Pleurochrysis_carterae.AAC.1
MRLFLSASSWPQWRLPALVLLLSVWGCFAHAPCERGGGWRGRGGVGARSVCLDGPNLFCACLCMPVSFPTWVVLLPSSARASQSRSEPQLVKLVPCPPLPLPLRRLSAFSLEELSAFVCVPAPAIRTYACLHALLLQVVIISSGGERGMFRYDDNVKFVKDQVLPVIEAHRTRVVEVR